MERFGSSRLVLFCEGLPATTMAFRIVVARSVRGIGIQSERTSGGHLAAGVNLLMVLRPAQQVCPAVIFNGAEFWSWVLFGFVNGINGWCMLVLLRAADMFARIAVLAMHVSLDAWSSRHAIPLPRGAVYVP